MDNFTFYSPTFFVFGKDTETQAGEYVKRFGGSVIDSSKAIAAGTIYDGDFWDFYSGKPIEKALPVGTVLTIAAASEEARTGTATQSNMSFRHFMTVRTARDLP